MVDDPPDPAEERAPGDVAVDVDPDTDLHDRDRNGATAPRHRPWAALSGIVVLVYVVVLAAGLSQIADRNRFNRWGAAMGSLGARLVICVVVLAALFHTFDGLRRLVAEVAPATAVHDLGLRTAVLFLTWAVAIPCFAAIVWPWIAETTR